MQRFLEKSRLIITTSLLVIFFFAANCGGGGGGGAASDPTGFESGDGDIVEVDPIFVRTGIVSSTVIDEEYRSVVYVGRSIYQEGQSEYDLSFNPSKNFLRNLEYNE
ncbi:MAG: hypothetical protein HQM16_18365 [Deltaproteobacteria bacterium]|nr:hypothetical protein [Deltaproteobacteria bacterium]